MENRGMRRSDGGGLVYSTDGGRMCPICRHSSAQCQCPNAKLVPAGDGMVRVSRSSKGRGGKTVTLVQGLALPADELAALGKQLRAACGAGGTHKEGVLEVQGDHVTRVLAWLQAKGLKAKRSGG
jgi:translation initiation factor 1